MDGEGWFGESWGAAVCDPNHHVATPIGQPCLRCLEPIFLGNQGILKPHVTLGGGVTLRPQHITCLLMSFTHPPECPHCRGHERHEHAIDCAYRLKGVDDCSCAFNPFAAPVVTTNP